MSVFVREGGEVSREKTAEVHRERERGRRTEKRKTRKVVDKQRK